MSDPLGLELKMIVSHLMGTGNLTHVFWKSSQCSEPLSYLFSTAPPISKFLILCFIVESKFNLSILFVGSLLSYEVWMGGNVVRATVYVCIGA